MTFDHRAAPTLNRLALFSGDCAVFHIRERDRRPDGLAFILEGVDLCHAGGNVVAELVEHRLNITDLGA